MPRNMSNVDRALRTVVVAPAAVIVGLFAGPTSVLAIVLYALAAVMLATSAKGFCPLYTLVHLDTRGRRSLPH